MIAHKFDFHDRASQPSTQWYSRADHLHKQLHGDPFTTNNLLSQRIKTHLTLNQQSISPTPIGLYNVSYVILQLAQVLPAWSPRVLHLSSLHDA